MLSQCFGLICTELLPATLFLWPNNKGDLQLLAARGH